MRTPLRGLLGGACVAGGVLVAAPGASAQLPPVAQVVGQGAAPVGPVAPLEVRFPEYGWSQEVEGEELYRQGRNALNQRDYREAAARFRQLRERYPNSPFSPDSYYYQAFAEYRVGQDADGASARSAYRRALELLERQAADFEDAETESDARALRGRVQAELARLGDAESRAAVNRNAQVACDSEDAELRASALSALLNMDADRARPILEEVLASRDACGAELRAQAIFILAQNADDETVDLLLDLAYRNPDPDPEVRGQAVFWLGQVDSPEAVDALVGMLEESTDPEVVEHAIFALSQHNDPRTARILMDYARRPDASADLRGHAIFWLGQHGGSESVGFLTDIFADVDDAEVKESILFAISQSDDAEADRFVLDVALDESQDSELRKTALFWAGQSGVPAGTLMEVYRSSNDREVQEAVIFGLSQQGGTGAVDALMEIARSSDDSEVRGQAVFWLGQMDDERIPAFLLEIIRR